MKKAVVAALFLTLIISAGAFAAGDATAGKDVYAKRCQACHAADGNGNAALAKAMNATIPPLPSKEVQAQSDGDLGKVITAGKGKMKPVAGLSAADVTNVVAYIRSLAKK
jgi:mono/diheme cytochrome c family protein